MSWAKAGEGLTLDMEEAGLDDKNTPNEIVTILDLTAL
jgi:hypothetical protein